MGKGRNDPYSLLLMEHLIAVMTINSIGVGKDPAQKISVGEKASSAGPSFSWDKTYILDTVNNVNKSWVQLPCCWRCNLKF